MGVPCLSEDPHIGFPESRIHDAKVAIKHYAQTTDDHFERAAGKKGGVKSGADVAQKEAQQVPAGIGREWEEEDLTPRELVTCAVSCDLIPDNTDLKKRRGRDLNPR